MHAFKSLLIALFLLPIFPSTTIAQDSIEAIIQRIESRQADSTGGYYDHLTLQEMMDELGVPGVSIAVISDYEIHWAKGYGMADVESGAPVEVHTMFQAASISKPVAAMAVMKAVQEGHFALDDDINTIMNSWQLPESDFTRDRPVTPRMLTSHTSGLGDGFGFPGYNPGAPIPTLVQIMKGEHPSNVGAVFMERPPMTAMKYSGGGVTMMQLALSDALGKPFEAIAQQWILDPIGMTDSSFEQPLSPGRDQHAARAHDKDGNSMDVKWHVYPELAAAGLWTTPTDLAKFTIEVQKTLNGEPGQVLDRAHVMEMVTPVGVGGFAVGFGIAQQGQGWYFSHTGANWGYRCSLLAHKSNGYGVIVMTNADRGSFLSRELKYRIGQAYNWDMFAQPVPR